MLFRSKNSTPLFTDTEMLTVHKASRRRVSRWSVCSKNHRTPRKGKKTSDEGTTFLYQSPSIYGSDLRFRSPDSRVVVWDERCALDVRIVRCLMLLTDSVRPVFPFSLSSAWVPLGLAKHPPEGVSFLCGVSMLRQPPGLLYSTQDYIHTIHIVYIHHHSCCSTRHPVKGGRARYNTYNTHLLEPTHAYAQYTRRKG